MKYGSKKKEVPHRLWIIACVRVAAIARVNKIKNYHDDRQREMRLGMVRSWLSGYAAGKKEGAKIR